MRALEGGQKEGTRRAREGGHQRSIPTHCPIKGASALPVPGPLLAWLCAFVRVRSTFSFLLWCALLSAPCDCFAPVARPSFPPFPAPRPDMTSLLFFEERATRFLNLHARKMLDALISVPLFQMHQQQENQDIVQVLQNETIYLISKMTTLSA